MLLWRRSFKNEFMSTVLMIRLSKFPERWLIASKCKTISVDKFHYFMPQWSVLIWSPFQIKEEKEHVCTSWFMAVCTCGPCIPLLSAPAFIANTSLINSGQYWFVAPFEDTSRVKTPMNNKREIHWRNSSALILKVLIHINSSSFDISFSSYENNSYWLGVADLYAIRRSL